MVDRERLIQEIKIIKSKSSSLKNFQLFEEACINLNFTVKKFFFQDPTVLYCYLCEVILNDRYTFNGSGSTKEEAYNSAIINYFDCVEIKNREFSDDIIQNISLIDDCDRLITFARIYFSKHILSKINRINYENLKKELNNNSSTMNIRLSEKYRLTDHNETLCSIFLNDTMLVQQSVGKDDKDALDSTVGKFLDSYSIISNKFPEEINNEIPFDITDVLEKLNQYLREQKSITNYFVTIEEFLEKLQLKMKVNFVNDTASVEINGVTVVRAKHPDKYISHILVCQKLVEKIEKSKKIDSNAQKKSLNSPTSKDSQKPLCLEEFNSKLNTIITDSIREHESNETRPWWTILNSKFVTENLKVEPNYDNDKGLNICRLVYKNSILAEGSGLNRERSREDAAKNLISKFDSNSP